MQVLKKILEKRGLTTDKQIEKFLNPPKPSAFTAGDLELKSDELKKTTNRVQEAILKNQPIFIHGDYDVDGICATAILWETIYFNLSYQNVHPFIPHRITHGYGLTKESIEEISQKRDAIINSDTSAHPGVGTEQCSVPTMSTLKESAILITLDCGITALEEVECAKSKGFEVIVLDHHEAILNTLPHAFSILHSTKVCATSLAWFLSSELGTRDQGPGTRNLDLTALATIADLEPLTDLNRSFAKYGLEELNQTQRIGLQELIKIAGVENRKIGTYEVGWILGPRLNAMGRLEHALDSLRLLCTRDRNRARELAQKLNEANYQRQEMTKKAVEEARLLATRNQEPGARSQLLILSHSSWHEGIIGLIASKITEEFQTPTLAISVGEKVSKGSARSINGFNIVEALRVHQDLLVNVGGHPMAAGLTIETTKIAEFTERFLKRSDLQREGPTSRDKIVGHKTYDLELSPNDLTLNLYQDLEQLEPFGLGNPQPLFLIKDLEITDLRLVGNQNQHLKLKLKTNEVTPSTRSPRPLAGEGVTSLDTFDAIGFSLGYLGNQLKVGDKIALIFNLEKNDFNGNQKVQLKIREIVRSNLDSENRN